MAWVDRDGIQRFGSVPDGYSEKDGRWYPNSSGDGSTEFIEATDQPDTALPAIEATNAPTWKSVLASIDWRSRRTWAILVILAATAAGASGAYLFSRPTEASLLADRLDECQWQFEVAERFGRLDAATMESNRDNCIRAANGLRPLVSRSTASAPRCKIANGALLEAVAAGVDVAIDDGRVVAVPASQQNESGWPGFFFSAALVGPGLNGERAVWAVNSNSASAGPIWAVDGLAREFSDWGSAAQAGSQADVIRTRLARSAEARQAGGC